MNNDIERAQEIAKRVNQAREGTGRSVTVEDIITFNQKHNAWDDMRNHMEVQPGKPASASKNGRSSVTGETPTIVI